MDYEGVSYWENEEICNGIYVTCSAAHQDWTGADILRHPSLIKSEFSHFSILEVVLLGAPIEIPYSFQVVLIRGGADRPRLYF